MSSPFVSWQALCLVAPENELLLPAVLVMVAYQELDTEKAAEIWHRDREIDKIYFGLLTQLRTTMIEDSTSVSPSTTLLFMGRCCERIGDHITNVAENVEYIVSGEMYHGRPMQLRSA